MSRPPRVSWENLSQPGGPPPVAPPTSADTPEEMVMRVLTGAEGRRFLEWMRSETIEKRNRAGASDADLRELEAQRQFVARLEVMIEKGREIVAARAKQPKT